MSLTTAQKTKIRQTIGDLEEAQLLTDAELQEAYDEAEGDFPTTYVYCLERLLGLMRPYVDQSNQFGTTESYSQRFKHTQELLEYWGNKANLSGGRAYLGYGQLNLDTRADDE